MTLGDLFFNLSKNKLGKKKYQRIWEGLYGMAIAGMNCSGGPYGGDFVEDSGEEWVVQNVLYDRLNKKGAVAFDVGANIGKYTNLICKTSKNEDLKIHSFEPAGKTYETLCKNVTDSRAVLNHFGLSDKITESVTLYSDEDNSGLASLYKRDLDFKNIDFSKQEQVALRTVDDYCLEQSIKNIDLLKMDVEGNEMSVLKGAERMLDSNAIYAIQFEFGGTDIDARLFFKDFWDFLSPKYKIYRILKDGLQEIVQYSNLNEIFLGTNYLAIQK